MNIDNPAGAGTVVSGSWYTIVGQIAAESDFVSITFTTTKTTRIGVLISNAEPAQFPTSLRVRQTAGGSADSGLIPTPTNAKRNGDWYFFDVTASQGHVFVISGMNNPAHASNGIGALSFDNPGDLFYFRH